MKSTNIRVVPVANMARKIDARGSVVMVKAGAFPGFRIHWATPERGPAAAAGESPITSEQLVNGDAYGAPNGTFREFWITTPSQIANPNESLELRVIDAASPVLVLNPRRFDGFKFQIMQEAVVNVTHPGSTVAYQSNPQPSPAYQQGYAGDVAPRGWLAGGASAASPFQVEMYAALDVGGIFFAEICRWFVDTADASGRYSCSFENGARNSVFNNYGSTAMIPWPARGLKCVVRTTTVTLSDFYFSLWSRTGSG